MRVNFLCFFLSLFCNAYVLGQKEEILSILPKEIRSLLFDNASKESYVDSIEFEEVECSRMTRWVDTCGLSNYRYSISYNILGVHAEIFICQYDSTFFISEYDYLRWNSIFKTSSLSKVLSVEEVKAKITTEIRKHCIEIGRVKINEEIDNQLYDGWYNDKFLKKKKYPFTFRITLFEGNSLTNAVMNINKMINFNDLGENYFEYKTFFCLYGKSSSSDKKGKLDLSMERYRRVLFDPITFNLESDAIISPVVYLIE